MALRGIIATLVALVSVQVLLVTGALVAAARREPTMLFCSMLPTEECAFAVDSLGHRCVLETLSGGIDWHVCQTSDIVVSEGSLTEYIETDECVRECGVAKMTVGLSTDSLESTNFTSKLCSLACQKNCPNLVDLFTNLAAGEGKSLRVMCARHSHQSWEMAVRRRREATEVVAALDSEEELAQSPSSI